MAEVFEAWPRGRVCTTERPERPHVVPPVQMSVLTSQSFHGPLLSISNSRAVADVPQITVMESSSIPFYDRSLANSWSHMLNQMGIKSRSSWRPHAHRSLSPLPHPGKGCLTRQTTHTQTKGNSIRVLSCLTGKHTRLSLQSCSSKSVLGLGFPVSVRGSLPGERRCCNPVWLPWGQRGQRGGQAARARGPTKQTSCWMAKGRPCPRLPSPLPYCTRRFLHV